MHFNHVSRRVCRRSMVIAMCVAGAFGQTTIDLGRQGRNVDFSGAPFTRPSKTGTALPSTCNVGETFFLTSAPAGNNWYGCAAANSWSLQGGGTGGGSSSGSLNQFPATVSGNAMTLDAGCSPSAPCNARVGATTYAFTGPAAATLSSGSGIAHVYLDANGILTVGHTFGTGNVACNSYCTAIAGITAFPPDSIPLWTWTGTSGAWDPSGMTDFRAYVSGAPVISATSGISMSKTSGAVTLSVDGTQVPYFSTVQGLPAAAGKSSQVYVVVDGAGSSDCSAGGGNFAVLCKSNGTAWLPLSIGNGGGSGGGGVSSVALAMPSFITVSGSPVTSSGTLTGTLASQPANTLLIGPSTGSAAPPAFRKLAAADIPNPAGDVTGTYGATVVTGVNGAAVPSSASCVGTNASGQLVSATCGSGSGGGTGLPSLVYSDMIDTPSAAGNYQQTIKSWTLPANTLAANGAALQVDAWVKSIAPTGSVTLNFGGADVYAGPSTVANTLIQISCMIRRNTSSSEYAFCRIWHGSNIATFAFENSLSADLTVPQSIAIRGLNGNGSAGDILVHGWTMTQISAH